MQHDFQCFDFYFLFLNEWWKEIVVKVKNTEGSQSYQKNIPNQKIFKKQFYTCSHNKVNNTLNPFFFKHAILNNLIFTALTLILFFA
jgi:hypothetical protein